MYKVLIVDDERIIREGISRLIDWERHGFALIGIAKNALEALDQIHSQEPHIVITDIKMPIMDGLALIKQVKESHPGILFVVLSGYGEFELANEAMRSGVRHYLLKPCNEDEILAVLNEVQETLIQRERREAFIQRNKKNLDRVMPLVREQFLRDYVMNRSYTLDEYTEYCTLLDIAETSVRLILFQPEQDFEFHNLYVLSELISEAFGQQLYFHTILKNQVLVLTRELDSDGLVQRIERVKHDFLQFDHVEITTALSDEGSFHSIPQMYRETQECLKYAFYVGEGSIVTKADIEKCRESRYEDLLTFDLERITLSIKSGNMPEMDYLLEQFFETLRENKCTYQVSKIYVMELFMAILRGCSPEAMGSYMEKILDLQQASSLDAIQGFIKCAGRELASANHGRILTRHSTIVGRMIQAVETHLPNEDLSLKWIARNILYMNEGYLSKLFFKNTGERFSQYLTRIRMEKARELIRTCAYERVYEVAEKVGLGNNPQYFSQLFKKYTGCSPTDYTAADKSMTE